MLRVNNGRDPCDCEALTDAERRLDAARAQLRRAMSSESVHALNVSSPGMIFHETMVHANLRCLRRG